MGTFFLLSRYNLAAILTREAPICEPNIGMYVQKQRKYSPLPRPLTFTRGQTVIVTQT